MKGINRTKDEKWDAAPEEFISIIIPFRNESENILQSLESIANQDYTKDNYEVIYINDKSVDDSMEKITKADKSCNVKVISVPSYFLSDAGKIRAIKFGIENSNGKIIITTDCDCIHQRDWLSSMIKCFDQKTGFIAGPVVITDGKTLFGKIQKLEFAGLVLAGAGLLGINKPVICNSANLAFKRDAYDLAGGFQIGKDSFSSADEFLMLSIKKKTNYAVKFCWSNDSITSTKASNSVKEFFKQRIRWAGKDWKRYGADILLQLVLVYLFYTGLIVQLIFGIVLSAVFLYSFLASFLIKIFSEYRILKNGKGLFYDRLILKIFFLAEILHIPYILIAGLSGVFSGFNWKKRKFNL